MEIITNLGPVWQVITWFITVGLGIVGYKYFDRWWDKESSDKTHTLDSNKLVIETLMEQVKSLTARIDSLEKEREAYHLREVEVTKQLVTAQSEVQILRREVQHLKDKQSELVQQVEYYKNTTA